MRSLLAARGGKDPADSPKDTRDRAFTYLKAAVDQVRAYGKHVFRKDPRRARVYASDYERKKERGKGPSRQENGSKSEPVEGKS